MWRGMVILSVLALVGRSPSARGQDDAAGRAEAATKVEFFERHVRPLLAEHCFACHGAKKQESGLRLDSRQGLLQGGDGGAIVDLSDPTASRLLAAVRRQDPDFQMPPPPRRPLVGAEIDAIARWLGEGAHWPEGDVAAGDAADAQRAHWAFQPIARPRPPVVADRSWPQSPIDCFVLARLEVAGMRPRPRPIAPRSSAA